MDHRDKCTNRLESPLNSRVSGSVSNNLNRQHPAISRAFLDPSSGFAREVSTPRAWVAVGGVEGELVLWGRIPDLQGKYREMFANPS